eukprot:1719-Pelagococcus_subviridis.AAC.3
MIRARVRVYLFFFRFPKGLAAFAATSLAIEASPLATASLTTPPSCIACRGTRSVYSNPTTVVMSRSAFAWCKLPRLTGT